MVSLDASEDCASGCAPCFASQNTATPLAESAIKLPISCDTGVCGNLFGNKFELAGFWTTSASAASGEAKVSGVNSEATRLATDELLSEMTPDLGVTPPSRGAE